jgi:hypothetical protein
VLDRVHRKGWLLDPKNRNKSVTLTKEGLERAERLFDQMFAKR